MRTIYILIVVVSVIGTLNAQLGYKNIYLSGNAANIYLGGEYELINEINYQPRFGFGVGTDIFYNFSRKVLIKFPVAYESINISNYGHFIPMNTYRDPEQLSIKRDNLYLGIVAGYRLGELLEIGIGPVLNYSISSRLKMSDELYESIKNDITYFDADRIYSIDEVGRFKYGYLVNLEITRWNPIIFLRFKQSTFLKEYESTTLKQYETVFTIGVKYDFNKNPDEEVE